MTADRRLDRRMLRGPVATIGVTWTDQNDAPADPGSAPTVSVANMAGTVVHTGTATGVTGQTGRYTVTLPAAATATLDILTATWTVSGVSRTTSHEVAGGFYFNLAEARLGPLDDAVKFPDDRILLGRIEVEDECEFICGVAFVPRAAMAVVVAEGGYELRLPHPRIRAVRSISVTPWNGTATAWTSGQLAEIRRASDGRLTAPTGFANGDQVVVVYEHGYDRPPAPIAGAALRRLRSLLIEKKPQVYDFGRGPEVVNDPTASAGPYRTGDDVVDAVYFRYSERQRGNQAAAVSRQLVYEPQRLSLFHRRPW